jgi:surface polysaccharide O-acyltransferase-like enzyme
MIAPASPSKPTQANVPSAAGPTPRWPLLEVGRWIAIYAIVWLHTVQSVRFPPTPWMDRSTWPTRFAVPFFVATCVFLVFQGVRRKPQRMFVEYGWQRFVRIYLPFLAWSAVYLGFKAMKSALMPEQENRYPSGLDVLWAGGFYHLWFLPFILAVSLAAFAIAKAVHGRERLRWPVAIGSTAAGVAIGLPGIAAALAPIHPPLDYMLNALPAAFWGVAVGLMYDGEQRPLSRGLSRCGIDVLAFLACMGWLWMFGRSTLVENQAGVLTLLIALRPTSAPLFLRVSHFPSLAYGIYFAHLLPITICESLAARAGLSPSWTLKLAIFFVSAAAATLLAWLLYRWRWTRWLVA